jgi:hypothetical protein
MINKIIKERRRSMNAAPTQRASASAFLNVKNDIFEINRFHINVKEFRRAKNIYNKNTSRNL